VTVAVHRRAIAKELAEELERLETLANLPTLLDDAIPFFLA